MIIHHPFLLLLQDRSERHQPISLGPVCVAPFRTSTADTVRAGHLLSLLLFISAVVGCNGASTHVTGTDPMTCSECHIDITSQWLASAHSRAWNNPDFQNLISDGDRPGCLPCHAPEPILERPPGEEPVLRSVARQDGVDCHACHAFCGAYSGRHDTFGPHGMNQDVTHLPCSAFCGSCHRHEYDEYEEQYLPSLDDSSQAWTCAECHMPRYFDRLTQGHILSYIHPRRWVPDHSFPLWTPQVAGGALEVTDVRITPVENRRRMTVRLQNTGAGHRIPTGKYGHHEIRITVELTANGRPVWTSAPRSISAGREALAPGEATPIRFAIRRPFDVAPDEIHVRVESVDADGRTQFVLLDHKQRFAP